MNLVYLFRHRSSGCFSIEQLFSTLSNYISQKYPIEKKNVPYPTNSIINLIRNQLYILKNSSGDIYHVTGDIHYVILSLLRKKTILTIHDCVILDRTPKQSIKYHAFLWLWYKLPIWGANVVTTISEKSKAEIVAYTGCAPEKIKVIPNFVSPEFLYHPKEFNEECPEILHIGTAPNKNLERLIVALEGLDCVLKIIGKLSESVLRLLNKHRIIYQNDFNLSSEAIIECYRTADIVSFVSLYEGFGMPVVEGQAIGRPVVTSNIEPITWVAGQDAACFVDPNDITAIKNGILKVIRDRSYRTMLIQNGLENVKRFKLETIGNQYLSLYEALMP